MQILHGEPLNIKLHFGLNCARRQGPSKSTRVCFSNGYLIFNFGWSGVSEWNSHKNKCSGNNFYVLCNVLIKNPRTNYIKSPSSKYWLIMPSRNGAPPFPCFRHKLVRARNMNLSTAAAGYPIKVVWDGGKFSSFYRNRGSLKQRNEKEIFTQCSIKFIRRRMKRDNFEFVPKPSFSLYGISIPLRYFSVAQLRAENKINGAGGELLLW